MRPVGTLSQAQLHPVFLALRRLFHKSNHGFKTTTHVAIVGAVINRINSWDDVCWASQLRIAKDAGVSKKTVQRYLPELLGGDFPLLVQRRGKGRRFGYAIFKCSETIPWVPHVKARPVDPEQPERLGELQARTGTAKPEPQKVASIAGPRRGRAEGRQQRPQDPAIAPAQVAAFDPRKPGPRRCPFPACSEMRVLKVDGKYYNYSNIPGADTPLHPHQGELVDGQYCEHPAAVPFALSTGPT